MQTETCLVCLIHGFQLGDIVKHSKYGDIEFVVCGMTRRGGVLAYRVDGKPMWTLMDVNVMYDGWEDGTDLKLVKAAS